MANQFDVILGFQEESYQKLDITYLHLFDVDICCVVSDRHPFARRDTIRLEELCFEQLIACNSPDLPGEISYLQKQLESHIGLSDIYYCEDISVALSMVRAGFGFAILPDMQSNLYSDVKCIPVEDVTPLSYGIYYKRSGLQNPVLKRFISILK
jgi:DNA-binding transcriptional LysR family regulator